MLTFTPQAVAYIKDRNSIIYLELPPLINCCIQVQEAPMVKIGHPPKPEYHSLQEIEGITIYLPEDFPEIPLQIELTSFLSFKKLVIEGWHLA